MWHSFRITTLFISLALSLFRHFRSQFSGTPEIHGDTRIYVQKKYDKASVKLVRVGVEVNSGFRFDIRRESDRDRSWKSLGLIREISVGNESFDDCYFIVTDDKRVEQCLRANRPTLLAIDHLLTASRHMLQPTALRCQRGFLWVEAKCTGLSDRDVDNYVADVRKQLKAVGDQFSDFKHPQTSVHDFSFHVSALPLVLSSGLAVYGGIQTAEVVLPNFPHLVDGAGFLLVSAFVGLVVFVLLCLLARWLLVGSSRFHIVMLELVTVGLFGAMTSSAATLHQLNTELDVSTPKFFTAQLVDKEKVVRYGRRGRRHVSYHFHFAKDLNTPATRKYTVSEAEFKRTARGQRFEFAVHEGAFGWRYVASMRRKDSLIP